MESQREFDRRVQKTIAENNRANFYLLWFMGIGAGVLTGMLVSAFLSNYNITVIAFAEAVTFICFLIGFFPLRRKQKKAGEQFDNVFNESIRRGDMAMATQALQSIADPRSRSKLLEESPHLRDYILSLQDKQQE